MSRNAALFEDVFTDHAKKTNELDIIVGNEAMHNVVKLYDITKENASCVDDDK